MKSIEGNTVVRLLCVFLSGKSFLPITQKRTMTKGNMHNLFRPPKSNTSMWQRTIKKVTVLSTPERQSWQILSLIRM